MSQLHTGVTLISGSAACGGHTGSFVKLLTLKDNVSFSNLQFGEPAIPISSTTERGQISNLIIPDSCTYLDGPIFQFEITQSGDSVIAYQK